MPLCPNCKKEYSDDVLCPECNIPLVEELQNTEKNTLLVQMEASKLEFAEKLIGYLSYSDIIATYSIDKKTELLSIYVSKEDVSKAKRCFQAFYTVEAELEMENAARKAAGETLEEPKGLEDELEFFAKSKKRFTTRSRVYIKKEEQYTDYKSSANMFLFFGLVGILFILLNVIGIIQILITPFSLFVMGLMFFAFLVISILSYKKAIVLKKEIGEEQETVKELTRWLENAVTREELEACEQEGSDEIIYLKKIALLKSSLTQGFPELDDAFADHFIEEFYNTHYEK